MIYYIIGITDRKHFHRKQTYHKDSLIHLGYFKCKYKLPNFIIVNGRHMEFLY